MAEKGYTEQDELIARYAKAMGHPARMAILRFLASQDSCFFGDIHDVLPIAKATVSQHLKELKEAGLIQGEIQPPKVKYCINARIGLRHVFCSPSFFAIASRKSLVVNNTLFLYTMFVVRRITYTFK